MTCAYNLPHVSPYQPVKQPGPADNRISYLTPPVTREQQEGNFTPSNVELLDLMTAYAALAMENARLQEKVLADRQRVFEVEAQMRRKLANELHDGPVQLVSTISLCLDICRLVLEKDPASLAAEITTAQEMARQAIYQMRTILFELRPLSLEGQGLPATLQIFLERRQKEIGRTRLMLKLETDPPGGEISRQADQIETIIFAMVQEAVNNAIKHAQARNIVVELKETPASFSISITDDGNGFDPVEVMSNYEQRGSLGLINLRERAELVGGKLVIQAAPGQGTCIALSVAKAKTSGGYNK